MTVNYGPLRRPRAYSRGRPEGPPRYAVVHYTAGAERNTSAEDGAAYDARRTDGTSTHYFHDANSTVQCVDTADRAHAALWHGNIWGIQHELCGTAQTTAQWLDAQSRPTIRRAGAAIARDLRDWGIPLQRLVVRDVRTGRGITGHKDLTLGWPEDGGSHLDPDGPRPGSFPWATLLDDVREFYVPTVPPRTPTQSFRKWAPDNDFVSTIKAPGSGAVHWEDVFDQFYICPHANFTTGKLDHIWRLRAANDALNGPGRYERVLGGQTDIKVPGRLGY